jgi:DHA1 family multidrug resistance protein-like MFS transporter
MSEDSTAPETEEATASRPSSNLVDERGHPGWRVTLPVMWIAQLCSIVGFSFVMPFIPFFVRELGVPEKTVPIWAGITITGAGIAMSIMGPVWGFVADRYGRKLMVMRAMLGGSIVLALMGLSQNIYHLLVLRILQGSITGTVPASVALISSVVPKRRLGFSLGLMQMAVFTGASIGPYLGGVVADSFGYRIPFGVTGALLFTGGLLVLFGANERFERPSEQERAETPPLRLIFQTPGIVVLLAVYFSMSFSMSFVMPIFPLFVEQIVGTPQKAATETGVLLAVTGIAAAIASAMVGRVSDRVGHRRVLIGCTTIAALFLLPHYPAQSLTQLLFLRILFGLGAGGMIPAMNAMIANIIPRTNIGQAYGFTTTASALGMAIGPAVGGWIASLVGYRPPFLIVGGLLSLVSLAQRRWLPRGHAEERLASEKDPAT